MWGSIWGRYVSISGGVGVDLRPCGVDAGPSCSSGVCLGSIWGRPGPGSERGLDLRTIWGRSGADLLSGVALWSISGRFGMGVRGRFGVDPRLGLSRARAPSL